MADQQILAIVQLSYRLFHPLTLADRLLFSSRIAKCGANHASVGEVVHDEISAKLASNVRELRFRTTHSGGCGEMNFAYDDRFVLVSDGVLKPVATRNYGGRLKTSLRMR